MAVNKRLIIIGVVVLCAVVGAIVGVLVATKSSSSSTSSEESGTAGSASGTSGGSSTSKKSSTTTGSGSSAVTSTVTSDPTSVTYSLAAFAIGDWGTTVTKDSCCTRSETYNNFDIVAEDVVSSLMNTQAGSADVKPKCIMSHGDNFYWTGINSEDGRDSRFTTTFEGKFDGDNLAGIPFVNVMGNHDYGGASYICSDGDNNAKCSSSDDLVTALENKFKWQQEYTSPNDDRWVLKDHFYVHTIEDADSGVSIDIFNVDSGDADVHAAQQVCCQCYGYSNGDDESCNSVARGDDYCCGGDTDMYDACFDKFTEWSDDSRSQLAEKVKSSNATWKIVNSHYSPSVHYAETGMKKWFDILDGSGIHAWVYGHTHGEKHDYSELLGVHFVENGAGGGIQKESASGITTYAADYVSNVWTYTGDEYGFFSLTASEDWLKLQYHTADSKWSFGSSMSDTTVGGVETKHCWYIPADGTKGEECSSVITFLELQIVQPTAALAEYQEQRYMYPEFCPFVVMQDGECVYADARDDGLASHSTGSAGGHPPECKQFNGLDGQPRIGPCVGAQAFSADMVAPYYDTVWFSYPSSCVMSSWTNGKSDACREQHKGGLCAFGAQPDGVNCTFAYKILGYLWIDQLVGITAINPTSTTLEEASSSGSAIDNVLKASSKYYKNYSAFCTAGNVEFHSYDQDQTLGLKNVTSIPFWENPSSLEANIARTRQMIALYNELADEETNHMQKLPTDLDALRDANPPCYENAETCYDAQFGCRRHSYAQVCSLCRGQRDQCVRKISSYVFPALEKVTRTVSDSELRSGIFATLAAQTAATSSSSGSTSSAAFARSGADMSAVLQCAAILIWAFRAQFSQTNTASLKACLTHPNVEMASSPDLSSEEEATTLPGSRIWNIDFKHMEPISVDIEALARMINYTNATGSTVVQ
ncbi:unnamed protein product [Phytophthora fragariaefolia]|uniref:Unnamed protein product n=1 Tax=Phytophthora fragariaefolia TaxID=1490495 RepID=A0A9W6Y2D4_9STRA|nr:unnamed protein product [Phytophthora fragariaefolia]